MRSRYLQVLDLENAGDNAAKGEELTKGTRTSLEETSNVHSAARWWIYALKIQAHRYDAANESVGPLAELA
ncbi:hypothetical protein L915_18051 [Phytophthora nicotianae]|uniref:Uncharacterized protein n=1 Tax=Phytophthora nicotianae TaxID=4792 RepID=W2I5U5_PHYNI|nr:hypothetical protein L915_18051 [Phytophthora nicotianae]ETL28748.1 hypothetical protein L916_17956 [Phytophthora nicotianae]